MSLRMLLGVLAMPLLAAPEPGLAQPAAPAAGATAQAFITQQAAAAWSGLFRVDDAHLLDADVKAHGEFIAAAAPSLWAAFSRDQSGIASIADSKPPDDLVRLYQLVQLEAMSRWYLARAQAMPESAALRLLQEPRLCDLRQRRRSWWSTELFRLQRLPLAERAGAFAADRAALARLGDASWQAPEPPGPTALEGLPGWLDRLRGDATAAAPAGMAPILAGLLLGPKPRWNEPGRLDRCLIGQWWAREQVRQNAWTVRSAWISMGRALMPQPQDLFGLATSDEPDYPSAARRVEVEADITVSWRRDALGRPVEPRVSRRTIKMPPDAKTLQTAWLEHFDALALAKARAMKPRPPAADADPAALHHAEFRFHLAP